MSDDPELEVQELRRKLNKALRDRSALYQKSKQLSERVQEQHEREHTRDDVTRELLERQRELNFMLNRANIMLSRAQEANALLSLEFGEIVKALPEPRAKEFTERIDRINELFKKTGEVAAAQEGTESDPMEASTPPPPPNVREAEIVREPAKTAEPREVVGEPPAPNIEEPAVEAVAEEAVILDEALPQIEPPAITEDEIAAELDEPPLTEAEEVIISPDADPVLARAADTDLAFPPRERPWWRFGS